MSDESDRNVSEFPRGVCAMLEAALGAMSPGAGVREIWIRTEDGRVRKWRLTEEGGRDTLLRFDAPIPPKGA